MAKKETTKKTTKVPDGIGNRLCIAYIGTTGTLNGFCTGNMDLWIDGPIKDFECIREIQECVAMQKHLKTVSIVNIFRYEN